MCSEEEYWERLIIEVTMKEQSPGRDGHCGNIPAHCAKAKLIQKDRPGIFQCLSSVP